jgi:hypothetical protein
MCLVRPTAWKEICIETKVRYYEPMIARRRRWVGIALIVLLLSTVGVLIPAFRRAALRAAGWALVTNGRISSPDVIVVAVGGHGAGVLEAADLLHRGVATRVAVFLEPPTEVDEEFKRRGIPNEDATARSVRQLRALGVDKIDYIPGYVSGSEDEGPALAKWCDEHLFRSVLVVTTADHSRRLSRVLKRSIKGSQVHVAVHSARYSQFDPDKWWMSRTGTRTELEETEKLLLDLLRHPIS